jgi:membrane protease YdiL (CAAX protease family)
MDARLMAILAIFLLVILFGIHFFFVRRKVLFNFLIRPLFPARSNESLIFISEKLTGILFLGIVPMIVFVYVLGLPSERIGLGPGVTLKYWYLILVLLVLTALISFITSKTRKVQEISLELKKKDWYPRHIILSASLWMIYLFFYEFFFRGILWFLCVAAYGVWPALFINIALYSIVHLPKGKYMALGSIPVGLLFCLLSSLTGSFYAAFLIHISVNQFTDMFTLYNDPRINLHSIRLYQ